jgi:hypothetical protein
MSFMSLKGTNHLVMKLRVGGYIRRQRNTIHQYLWSERATGT